MTAPDRSASPLTAEPGEPLRVWHALDVARVSALLGADAERGLGTVEARRRLARVGPRHMGARGVDAGRGRVPGRGRSQRLRVGGAAGGDRAPRAHGRVRGAGAIHPLQALHCRSERTRWWRLPPNPLVWIALVALGIVQWGAVAWPPLSGLLGTVPLAIGDWLIVAAAIVWPVLLLEAIKGRASAFTTRPT